MQLYAGNEIITGLGYNGWASHFWPPLYPLLIGLGALLVPGFQAAKAISIIAGVVTLLIAYYFAIELSGSKKVGLLTQLFLSLNPLFFLSTIQAENHMINTLFFVSAIFLLFRAINIEDTNFRTFLYLGFIVGLAGLCRYTSYALVPIVILSIFLFINRRAFALFSAFLIGFITISLPWWTYNVTINGSPFYTWQYMNIGSHVFPNRAEWWWDAQANFDGVVDIIAAYPLLYIKNFMGNVFNSGILIVVTSGILAPFIIPAIFDSFLSIKFKNFLILFGGYAVFVLLVSQAFVFDQVFLSWVVIFTPLIIVFLVKYTAKSQEKYELIKKYHLGTVFVILLCIGGLTVTSWKIVRYVSTDDFDGGQLVRESEVTQALIEYDSDIEKKYVMSVHPARAYYSGSNWLMSPLYYEGSIHGFVQYENTHRRIKEYAPKFPSRSDISSLKADYLIYDIALKRHLPLFSFLLEKQSEETPANFNLIFWSPEVVVYEIVWE